MVNVLADWLALAADAEPGERSSAPQRRSANQLMMARLQIKLQECFGACSAPPSVCGAPRHGRADTPCLHRSGACRCTAGRWGVASAAVVSGDAAQPRVPSAAVGTRGTSLPNPSATRPFWLELTYISPVAIKRLRRETMRRRWPSGTPSVGC
jgi:hypothetical protein